MTPAIPLVIPTVHHNKDQCIIIIADFFLISDELKTNIFFFSKENVRKNVGHLKK